MQTYAIKWRECDETFLSMGETPEAATDVDRDRHAAYGDPDWTATWTLESATVVTDALLVEMFARTGPSGMWHDGTSWTVVLPDADGGPSTRRVRLP